ncbi:hypothetical protein NX722_23505 [Endozoicomonas gorgoniicola]|uniref:Scaffolding protein n=1 Tax=Endozoicomonas gorgoniicola TaxID=1234144 RepID=A0ABT3N1N9_9GAMM|nr:hypothetical protein [Endozoicomonas gorgoniicola]MCW7555534.1 hypothetical protein [Endozoicomonas gorgoniicola]
MDNPDTSTETQATDTGSSSSANPFASAYERARDAIDQEDQDTGTDPNSTDTDTDGQASDSNDGASSQEETVEAATEGDGASDQATDDSTSTESPEAPGSWPDKRKEMFSHLPREAQTAFLDSYKEMETGLNKALEKLGNERKQMRDNFGADPDAIRQLIEKAQNFESDPVPVITQLAESAGIEIFFTPQGDEQIPEFDSQQEQTQWLADKQKREVNQALAEKSRERARERAQEELNSTIQKQFAEAHQAHPDLADHRDDVVKTMAAEGVSVESAYRLATWEGLSKLAAEAQEAKAALEKKTAEIEKLKKNGTRPPVGGSGSRDNTDELPSDPFERAHILAKRRLNQG